MFGKYIIIDRIGHGGTGDVLLARHIGMEAFRAIKSIKKSLAASESFFYEVSILKNLRHPGIPVIYDIEEDEEFYYIVEEYVEGVSLDKYLQEYPKLSYLKKIRLLKQICDIVNFIHTQTPNPIVHLDIKPQNILINYVTDRVYLLDFGNGYILNNNTPKRYIHGTVGYTNVKQYDNVKSKMILDMYSLVQIIYYVLENITDNILVAMLKECTIDRECRVTAEDLCSYFDKKEKALSVSKKICVVGSRSGIGVTHLALALTTELNRRRMRAVYVNYNDMACLQSILEEKAIDIRDDGIVCIKESYCRLLPDYEDSSLSDNNTIQIVDIGIANLSDIKEYNNILILCGAREWEKEQTFSIYKELRPILDNRNVIKIFNCGTDMSVPYIKDPFNLNYIERKRFEKIIRKIKL